MLSILLCFAVGFASVSVVLPCHSPGDFLVLFFLSHLTGTGFILRLVKDEMYTSLRTVQCNWSHLSSVLSQARYGCIF